MSSASLVSYLEVLPTLLTLGTQILSFWIHLAVSVFSSTLDVTFWLTHTACLHIQDSDADTAVEFNLSRPFFNSQAILDINSHAKILLFTSSPDALYSPSWGFCFIWKLLLIRDSRQHPKGTGKGVEERQCVYRVTGQRLKAFPKRERRSVFGTRKTSSWKSYFPNGGCLSPWQAWEKRMGAWREALILLDVGGYPPLKRAGVWSEWQGGSLGGLWTGSPCTLY